MTTILVLPSGKLGSNPDLAYPEKPRIEPIACNADCEGECGDVCPNMRSIRLSNESEQKRYDSALTRYMEGVCEFEDQSRMKVLLTQFRGAWTDSGELKAGAVVSVDIQYEVVEQQSVHSRNEWYDYMGAEANKLPVYFDYRRVLRIKP